MKKIFLEASTALTDIEKMKMYNEGRRRENLKACGVDKLIHYYKICLDNDFHSARAGIEGELDRRDLTDHIVPLHYLKSPSCGMFTKDLAHLVVDARGDMRDILRYAYTSFSVGGVIIAAYILACIADDKALENDLRFYIKSIGAYDKYMKDFMDRCMKDPSIVAHLEELVKEMEDYAS